jgi:AhpD family alkylhydroperoxidase
MALEPRDKELVAIGASIGALCRPCIDHHVSAAREAGLSEVELARAVQVAQATRRIAQDLFFRHAGELVDVAVSSTGPCREGPSTSRHDELVRLGASLAANCHPLLEQHIIGCLEQGLIPSQVRSAIKMAEIVQQNAAEITAGKASAAAEAIEPTPERALASARSARRDRG